MALEFQMVDVKFTEGLDTRTQRKLLLPGKWDQLLNVTLSEDNTPQTRDGHAALDATANGNGLANRSNQLLTVNGPEVFVVDAVGSEVVQVPGGGGFNASLGNVDIDKRELRANPQKQSRPDIAFGDGYLCSVWTEMDATAVVTGIAVTVTDNTSGAQLLSGVTLMASANVLMPRVVYADGAFYCLYTWTSGGVTRLYCNVIETAAPTVVGGQTQLISSADMEPLNFDACEFDDTVAVVYAWGDGTTSVRVIGVDRTGTTPAISDGPVDVFAEADVPAAAITALAVAVYSSGTDLGVFVTSTGAAALCGLAGAVLDNAYAITTAGTQLDSAVGAVTVACHLCAGVDGTSLRVFRDYRSDMFNSGTPLSITATVVDVTLTVLSQTNIIAGGAITVADNIVPVWGPFIWGKPFTATGRVYLPVFVGSLYGNMFGAATNPRNLDNQNTFFVLDTGTESAVPVTGIVAKALYGSTGLVDFGAIGEPDTFTPTSSPDVQGTGSFVTVVGEQTQVIYTANGAQQSPIGLAQIFMTPNASLPPISKQLGECTFFAGGQLTAFDGAALVEHGFAINPTGVYVGVGGGGTGANTAGIKQVCVVYEWLDAAGNRYQSAPSPAVQATAVATGSLIVEVPTLFMTQRADIQVVPYVTLSGGVTFYRATSNAGSAAPVYNDVAQTFATYTVSQSDADLAVGELLYNQPNQAGSILPNVAPGPARCLAVVQNRLWFAKADQPGRVGYSQEYAPGLINSPALEFNDALETTTPLDAGKTIAIAELDEKVVIFCERRLFVVYGTGPTPSGGFSNYSAPQDIQSDVGCSDVRSVMADFPGGIIFKSSKGWYLLDRGLAVKYIGEAVHRWDGNTVTSATLLEDTQEIRFITQGDEGAVTLVYSYLVNQWSVYQYGSDYEPVGAAWWPAAAGGDGRYVTISLADGLNQDTPGTLQDATGNNAAVGITTRARTGFLHVAQLERFQRVRWLYLTGTADIQPESTLTITVDFDDVYGPPAPTGRYSFSVNLATAFPSWATNTPSIDLRSKLRRQKCKSVAFTFEELPGLSPQNRTTGWQAMALEVGIKRGTNKLRASQSVG